MRRAHVAPGHAAQLVRRPPLTCPDRARALTGDVTKGAPEGAEALPARLKSDLGDREVGVPKQRRRPLDAPREQVPVRRDAEGLLEGTREVGLGDTAHPRQSPDRPLLVRGGVHPVLGAQ